jgi:hypothetical protein
MSLSKIADTIYRKIPISESTIRYDTDKSISAIRHDIFFDISIQAYVVLPKDINSSKMRHCALLTSLALTTLWKPWVFAINICGFSFV